MRTIDLNIRTSLIVKIALVTAVLMGGWELRANIISILVLLFLAFIINAGVRPLVNRLEKRKLPRGLAVAIIYVSLLTVFSLVFIVIASQFAEQAVNLIRSLPEIFTKFVNFIKINVPVLNSILPLDQISSEFGTFINNFVNSQVFRDFASGENIFSLLRQALGLFSSVAELLVSAVTILMVSIYMAARREPAYKGILELLPNKHAKNLAPFIRKVEVSLGSWLIGQLVAMVSISLITYVLIVVPGLFVADYRLADFAIPIALMAGLLEALPNIGPLLTLVLTSILALGTSGVGVVIYIVIAFTALQQIEGILIIPVVMKKAIGIDPILSILGIIAGFQLGGIVGAILAIPLIGIALIIVNEVAAEYKKYERQNPKLIED